MLKLTIWREVTSEHQETASCAQKLIFTSNRKPSQAIHIWKQLQTESTDTSLFFSKQHLWVQKSMCQHCSSYYVVALTWLRHHSVHKFSANFSSPHKNETEGKKNKTSDITLLQQKTDFLWNNYKLSLQAVLLKRNYIWRQWLTSAKTALTLFNIEYKLRGDIRTTLSKTVRSEKISKETSLWKGSDKRISYRSFM